MTAPGALIPDGYRRVRLDGHELHHCPDLHVERTSDAESRPWLLLGWPIESAHGATPAERIAKTATQWVPQLTGTWNGRWVLIGGGALRADYLGLFGVVYGDGKVASSPALIRWDAQAEMRLERTGNFEWFPPPQSGFPRLERLLPSQILRLDDLTPQHRPLLTEVPAGSYEQQLDVLQDRLVRTVRQAWGRRNFVPLTAGFDSRLILAVAYHAGVAVETFTQVHRDTPRPEITGPPGLARAVGIPHQLIRPVHRRDQKRATDYDHQAVRLIREMDRHFLARGQWDFLRDGDLLIRGLGFEVGRAFYYDRINAGVPLRDVVTQAYAPDRYRRVGLDQWLAWVEDHPEPMDFRDRLYWEQRVAGWVSNSEMALEMLPAERMTVAASQEILSLLLQLPEDVRRRTQHHVDLIARMAPSLAQAPFNPREAALSPRRVLRGVRRRMRMRQP